MFCCSVSSFVFRYKVQTLLTKHLEQFFNLFVHLNPPCHTQNTVLVAKRVLKAKKLSAGRIKKIIDLVFAFVAFLVKFFVKCSKVFKYKRIMLNSLHKLTLISLDS